MLVELLLFAEMCEIGVLFLCVYGVVGSFSSTITDLCSGQHELWSGVDVELTVNPEEPNIFSPSIFW
jgi:hypothetical protein